MDGNYYIQSPMGSAKFFKNFLSVCFINSLKTPKNPLLYRLCLFRYSNRVKG